MVKNYQLIGDGMYAISAVLGYALPALGVMMVPIHLEALNVANAHLDVWSRSSLDNHHTIDEYYQYRCNYIHQWQ